MEIMPNLESGDSGLSPSLCIKPFCGWPSAPAWVLVSLMNWEYCPVLPCQLRGCIRSVNRCPSRGERLHEAGSSRHPHSSHTGPWRRVQAQSREEMWGSGACRRTRREQCSQSPVYAGTSEEGPPDKNRSSVGSLEAAD